MEIKKKSFLFWPKSGYGHAKAPHDRRVSTICVWVSTTIASPMLVSYLLVIQCFTKIREGQIGHLHGPNTKPWSRLEVRRLDLSKCTFDVGANLVKIQIWIVIMRIAWTTFEAHIDRVPSKHVCFQDLRQVCDRQRRYHLELLCASKVGCRGGSKPPLGGE